MSNWAESYSGQWNFSTTVQVFSQRSTRNLNTKDWPSGFNGSNKLKFYFLEKLIKRITQIVVHLSACLAREGLGFKPRSGLTKTWKYLFCLCVYKLFILDISVWAIVLMVVSNHFTHVIVFAKTVIVLYFNLSRVFLYVLYTRRLFFCTKVGKYT